MNILFAVSEIEGIIKTGGLADVARALSLQLQQRGHQVMLVMPAYATVKAQFATQLQDHRHTACPHYQLTHQGLQIYLVDLPQYFDRPELYAENNQGYVDNGERFAAFSQACLSLAQANKFAADVIHCNDWHTALVPYFVRKQQRELGADAFFANTKTVLTIHNAAFQGDFMLVDVPCLAGHGAGLYLDQRGCVNYLKTGIIQADKITTVSPRYAQELLTDLGSHGLSMVMQNRSRDLIGILNGCDYEQWSPEHDSYIPQPYSINTLDDKVVNKLALQAKSGLPQDTNIPVIGMVCRVTQQKGFAYLLPILAELMQHQVHLVIIGSGDPVLCSQLSELAKIYDTQLHFTEGFSTELAHLVEAGADFFLMPSEFEPCGLNQMYSLAYGTLPIVRAVGGLQDTVIGYSQEPAAATGFVFHEPSSQALFNCILNALLFYHESPEKYRNVQQRAMKTRFTWENAAKSYEHLYQLVIN